MPKFSVDLTNKEATSPPSEPALRFSVKLDADNWKHARELIQERYGSSAAIHSINLED
jgi:hypothetical protein